MSAVDTDYISQPAQIFFSKSAQTHPYKIHEYDIDYCHAPNLYKHAYPALT